MMLVAENDGAATQQPGEGADGALTVPPAGETPAGATEQGTNGTDNTAGADDEVVITIGEETPPSNEEETNAPAPQWLKDLRKSDREKTRRIRELEQAAAERERQQQPGAVVPGAKPTLESCNYDEAAFETKLTAWHEQQAQVRAEQKKKADAEQQANEAWQGRVTAYTTAKTELKVPDFEEAEAVVLETLSQTQQGIIINGADNPAHLVYALGKNPAKAKELASIKDPVKYAFAVAKLETQLKVTPRKTPPPAEKPVRGSAAATGMDSTLARLEAEADRTGDRSKVAAYRRDKARSQA